MGQATPITIPRARYCNHSDLSPRQGTFVHRTELRALTDLGRGPIVVVQHAAQTLSALDHACVCQIVRFRANLSVGQTLVIALVVVVRHEALNSCPQRLLANQDQPVPGEL
jgi:hypothetical protein